MFLFWGSFLGDVSWLHLCLMQVFFGGVFVLSDVSQFFIGSCVHSKVCVFQTHIDSHDFFVVVSVYGLALAPHREEKNAQTWERSHHFEKRKAKKQNLHEQQQVEGQVLEQERSPERVAKTHDLHKTKGRE